MKTERETLGLPQPRYDSKTSVERALLERRSIRDYQDKPIKLSDLSQLLWAAQGITDQSSNFRTAPSAGALYPLEIYVVIANVEGVATGVYKYNPYRHEIVKIKDGDIRAELSAEALWQTWIRKSSIIIIFTAVYERTTKKYGNRGIRYVHMEVGHSAQNVYLQAVSLGLGTAVIGAFNDAEVQKVVGMEKDEQPLYIMPVGVK
ncbi:MAG: SagB/ThcOx family dehydrogenase [Ignavibacteria bacterium]|nr:SagB/ThcOx family dehydrogenase [Ignavibacteria bacterium]